MSTPPSHLPLQNNTPESNSEDSYLLEDDNANVDSINNASLQTGRTVAGSTQHVTSNYDTFPDDSSDREFHQLESEDEKEKYKANNDEKIRQEVEKEQQNAEKRRHEANIRRKVGICFSGGGIRSGVFATGVLCGLIQPDNNEEVKIKDDEISPHSFRRNDSDYIISCVSGGGYTGSSFIYWARSHATKISSWFNKYLIIIEKMLDFWQDII
jgi:hypothetical protein